MHDAIDRLWAEGGDDAERTLRLLEAPACASCSRGQDAVAARGAASSASGR